MRPPLPGPSPRAFTASSAHALSSLADTPAYLPGRFHAHVRPSSPPIGPASRAGSVHHLPLGSPSPRALSSSPTSGSAADAHARQRSRTRPLGRALLALSGTKKRELREREEEEERAALLGAWIGGGASCGAGRATQAAALQAALGVPVVDEAAEDEDDRGFLRPGRKRVERWMGTWWRRWAVLVGAPCLLVRPSLFPLSACARRRADSGAVQIWLWCSVPFPVQDPYEEQPPWRASSLALLALCRSSH